MSPALAFGEIQGDLKKSGQVTLDATGHGTITMDPDHANQRWEVDGVTVYTNQAATATVVPVAALVKNSTDITQASPGNVMSQSWSGNQDTFQASGRSMDIGPCDFLSVIFSPPPGGDPTTLVGVIATAVVTGTKFTRRG